MKPGRHNCASKIREVTALLHFFFFIRGPCKLRLEQEDYKTLEQHPSFLERLEQCSTNTATVPGRVGSEICGFLPSQMSCSAHLVLSKFHKDRSQLVSHQ